MSKVFITGVNGFIGSHLAEKFLNTGHEVFGLVRKTSNLKFIKDFNIHLFYGDITERDSLSKSLPGMDVVVHNAAFASDWGSFEEFYKINVTGTQNVAEIASELNIKRFVHISTVAIHGFRNPDKMDESAPVVKSIFPYCETKRIADEWLFEFAKITKMEITSIKPGNVFGTRDHTFIEKYLDALEKGKGGFVDGGRHVTCPTYVENLADAVVLSSFHPSAIGEAFNITDGVDINWLDFTNMLADEMGIKRPKMSIPFPIGYSVAFLMEMFYILFRIKNAPILTRYRISNGGSDYHFSIEKARKLLGFEPKIKLEEAVRRSVEWYKNSRLS
ncbi:MAG: NAD-dependent epimerase/dehydratase family protein [Bacteroidetes bacterium]|nr:MAG: NAD-dependent epimerase/dehydratase family protein [Bacteroidota bacterium]